ncbi:hypothetical protein [Bacillus sp. NH11B]|uniref:hypothetical protein n=1 Tax=Bacillus sp. NH11B TaxID=1866314 RepID=UPI0015876F02|nr:hypothetical protein [Bacillus sp. NH11B]
MVHKRNSNWTKKLKSIRNYEALPPVIIRAIWSRYDRGQSPQKIYERLKEERQLIASFETVETYIEQVVKPYYEKERKN